MPLFSLRAYSGINVLQNASVVAEPVDHLSTESAANLLLMSPRTLSTSRPPTKLSNPGCSDDLVYYGIMSCPPSNTCNDDNHYRSCCNCDGGS